MDADAAEAPPPAEQDAAAAKARPKADSESMPPPPPRLMSKKASGNGANERADSEARAAWAGPCGQQAGETAQAAAGRAPAPYAPPQWGGAPEGIPYALEVLKNGTMLSRHSVSQKGHYVFGRSPSADFVLEHPSASRFHCVLQHNSHSGEAFLHDCGSTHGTYLNKQLIKPSVYVPLRVGDTFRFGQSSRLYVLQGPQELMPKEGLNRSQKLLAAKLAAARKQQERDEEKACSQMNEVISGTAMWGFKEDAPQDAQQEEIMDWKTYRDRHGLTEKQQKVAEKIRSRQWKIENMKKECQRISSKSASGDLTPGQVSTLHRNERLIETLEEEIEGLEETLQDSVQDALRDKTAKAGHKSGKRKRAHESDDESDDSDEFFYDLTRKHAKRGTLNKKDSKPSTITVEQLHTEQLGLLGRREEVLKGIQVEKAKCEHKEGVPDQKPADTAGLDSLDAFMSRVETQVEADKVTSLQKQLEEIESELDRVKGLMRIADPDGFYTGRQPKAAAVKGAMQVEAGQCRHSVAVEGDPQAEKTVQAAAVASAAPTESSVPSAQSEVSDAPVPTHQVTQPAGALMVSGGETGGVEVPLQSHDNGTGVLTVREPSVPVLQ
eukprot:evm.model.scf_1451.5 EVM.evm.TU.scf_1451.5   scf_1451:28607-38773(+)